MSSITVDDLVTPAQAVALSSNERDSLASKTDGALSFSKGAF